MYPLSFLFFGLYISTFLGRLHGSLDVLHIFRNVYSGM
jgi:hypothetical protein